LTAAALPAATNLPTASALARDAALPSTAALPSNAPLSGATACLPALACLSTDRGTFADTIDTDHGLGTGLGCELRAQELAIGEVARDARSHQWHQPKCESDRPLRP